MPMITYTAQGFPIAYGGALAGTFPLSVSWEEIIWAAISVGKAQLAHMTQYGVFSAFEFMYRAAIIYANLVETSSGRLRRFFLTTTVGTPQRRVRFRTSLE